MGYFSPYALSFPVEIFIYLFIIFHLIPFDLLKLFAGDFMTPIMKLDVVVELSI